MNSDVIKNERQFAEWFKNNFKQFGYSKIVRGDISRCPDFIMFRDGKEVGVELETLASNFVMHKHDIKKVDEIVCLINDVKLGIPVLEAKGVEFSLPRKVTLSIEAEIYDRYKKFCEDNAIMLSKKIELIMKKELEGGDKK